MGTIRLAFPYSLLRMSAAPESYDVQLRGSVAICHNTIKGTQLTFSPSSFVELRKLNMGDYLPEASKLVSCDMEAPYRDTCEDESQDEDKML